MYIKVEKPTKDKSRAVSNSSAQKKKNEKPCVSFLDNRAEDNTLRSEIKTIPLQMKRIVLSQSDTINNPIQMKRPYSTSDILKALKNLVTGGITVTKGKGDHIRVESTTDSNLKGTLTTPKCSKSMLGSCLQYLGLEISGNDFVRTYL